MFPIIDLMYMALKCVILERKLAFDQEIKTMVFSVLLF